MREQKQQEELTRLSQPSEKEHGKMMDELTALFPDAEPAHLDAVLRSQKENHLTNAANSVLGTPYPKKAKKSEPASDQTQSLVPSRGSSADTGGTNLFSSWRNKFSQSRQNQQPYSSLAAGTSSIERAPSGVGSGVNQALQPNNPSRPPAQNDEVTPTASIKNNVIKAVQASKPETSARVQSQQQMQEVHEASSSYCDVTGVAANLTLAAEIGGMRVFLSPELDPGSTLSENHDALVRLIDTIYKPVGEMFGLDPRSLNVFADKSGPNIAFNRGGAIFLNFRYYKEWHDDLVRSGDLSEPLTSTYFSVAHEIAHNVVHAHNAEHEYYFSSIAEHFLPKLMTTLRPTAS